MNRFLAAILSVYALSALPAAAATKAIPIDEPTASPTAYTASSPEVEVVTAAETPGLRVVVTDRPGSVIVIIDPKANPAATEYAVMETTSGTWVNPLDGHIGNTQTIWAPDAVWGGSKGVVVMTGTLANPMFAAMAKNGISEVTSPTVAVPAAGWFRSERGILSTALAGIVILLGLAAFAGLTEYEFLKVFRFGKGKKKHHAPTHAHKHKK